MFTPNSELLYKRWKYILFLHIVRIFACKIEHIGAESEAYIGNEGQYREYMADNLLWHGSYIVDRRSGRISAFSKIIERFGSRTRFAASFARYHSRPDLF